MTARSLSLTIDTAALKPTEALGCVARAGTVVGLTHRMMADLEQELGGYKRACKWLIALATETNRPIAINMPSGPDASTTVLLAPASWTEERLRGWAGGMAPELEEQFGPATLRPWGRGQD